jgi:hypothetical protein
MTDVVILYALSRSKKLALLYQVYQTLLMAKTGVPTPLNIRGAKLSGDTYDLEGTLTKRVKAA